MARDALDILQDQIIPAWEMASHDEGDALARISIAADRRNPEPLPEVIPKGKVGQAIRLKRAAFYLMMASAKRRTGNLMRASHWERMADSALRGLGIDMPEGG